jgi:flagellar assembly protein FliH
MPLIKSNQLIQAGTAVVAGDQIVAETGAPTPERAAAVLPPIPNLVIPSLDLPDASMADFFAADPEPAAAEPVAEAPPVETAPPEPEVVENPEVADFLSAFATEREALLEDARTEAEVAAQEATGQLGAPDAGLELDEAASAIRATYPEGTPAFEAAMESVTPYIEQQAASALEALTIQAANDGRWQELATAEEQIASLVDNFARRVLNDPPPELVLQSLLSEREAILSEARLQATRIVQQAEEDAARKIHEAQASAAHTILEIESRREAILEELRQKGYAEGYQEGRGQADEEAAKIVQDAMDSLDQLAGTLRAEVKRNEEKLLKLAIGIAEKILMDEVNVRPDAVTKALDEALNKVSDLEEVIIKVHPDDLPAVQAQEEAFRDRLRNVRKVEFLSSPKIQKGGVFIETASGSVDAQIKTQLSVIQEAFDAVRAEYGAEPLDMTGSG